jgi:hypothetical protein
MLNHTSWKDMEPFGNCRVDNDETVIIKGHLTCMQHFSILRSDHFSRSLKIFGVSTKDVEMDDLHLHACGWTMEDFKQHGRLHVGRLDASKISTTCIRGNRPIQFLKATLNKISRVLTGDWVEPRTSRTMHLRKTKSSAIWFDFHAGSNPRSKRLRLHRLSAILLL